MFLLSKGKILILEESSDLNLTENIWREQKLPSLKPRFLTIVVENLLKFTVMPKNELIF